LDHSLQALLAFGKVKPASEIIHRSHATVSPKRRFMAMFLIRCDESGSITFSDLKSVP
jgi:hypothetical protein